MFAVVPTVQENGEETHERQTFSVSTGFSLWKHHQSAQHTWKLIKICMILVYKVDSEGKATSKRLIKFQLHIENNENPLRD